MKTTADDLFARLNGDERAVLTTLVIAQTPIPFDLLLMLDPLAGAGAIVTDPDIETSLHRLKYDPDHQPVRDRMTLALKTLHAADLVRHRPGGLYAVAAKVRPTLYATFDGPTRFQLHTQMYNRLTWFEHLLLPHRVAKQADLAGMTCLYLTLIAIEETDLAARLYLNHLHSPLVRQFLSHDTVITLLKPLFPDQHFAYTPELNEYGQRQSIIAAAADALQFTDDLDNALVLRSSALAIALEEGNVTRLPTYLTDLGLLLLRMGRMAAALQAARFAYTLVNLLNDPEGVKFATLRLMILYTHLGWWTDADAACEAFSTDLPIYETGYWEAEALRVRAESLFGRDAPLDQRSAALDVAEQSAWTNGNTLASHSMLHLRAEVLLEQGQTAAALAHFQEAVAAKAKRPHALSSARGALAWALYRTGDTAAALRLVEEGCDDYHAAKILQRAGQPERAHERAAALYRAGYADGPPFVKGILYKLAIDLFTALGVPPPDLSPSDETTCTIPHADSIQALIDRLAQAQENPA